MYHSQVNNHSATSLARPCSCRWANYTRCTFFMSIV